MLLSFSANTLSPELLEQTLVGRKEILNQIEKELIEKVSKGHTYQSLLIAPRGSGKTHMTTALRYRIIQNKAIRKKILVAYMNEDERGIANFSDFIRHILQSFIKHKEGDFEKLNDLIYEVSGMNIPKQEDAFVKILLEFIGKKSLIILIENLNILFDQKTGMGSDGQTKLRSLMHEHNQLSILATSQNLFYQIQDPSAPFYGFFNIRHLEKLNFDETLEFIKAQAALEENPTLEEAIDTPLFTGKVRAIFQLTGGNHRLLVIFFNFLKADVKSDLSKIFEKTMNDLKPYYEQFLNALAPQQQKIIQFLSSKHTPQMGKDISRFCFIASNILSKQTSELEKKGYLDKNKVGKDTYYELKEALMRICFELNENAEGVVKLFVDFLTNWYSEEERQKGYLKHKYYSITSDGIDKERYGNEVRLFRSALQPEVVKMLDEFPIESCENPEELNITIDKAISKLKTINKQEINDPLITSILTDKEFEKNYKISPKELQSFIDSSLLISDKLKSHVLTVFKNSDKNDFEKITNFISLFKQEENIISNIFFGDKELVKKARQGKDVFTFNSPDYFEELKKTTKFNTKPSLYLFLGKYYGEQKDFQKQISTYNDALNLRIEHPLIYLNLAKAYSQIGKDKQAIKPLENVIRLNPKNEEASMQLGLIYNDSKKFNKAIKVYEEALKVNPKSETFIFMKGTIQINLNQFDEAIETFSDLIQLNPKNSDSYFFRGISFFNKKEYKKTIKDLKTVIKLNPKDEKSFLFLGETYNKLEKPNKAIQWLNKVIQINPNFENAHYNMGDSFSKLEKYPNAIKSFKKVIELNSKNENAYHALGNIYRFLNKKKEALIFYKNFINLNPKDTDWINKIGLYFIENKKLDDAISILKKGLKIDKHNWHINGSLHQAFLNMSDLEKSKIQFKKVLDLTIKNEHPFNQFLEEDIIQPLLKNTELKSVREYFKFILESLTKKHLLSELWIAFPKAIFHLLINIEEYPAERLDELYKILKEEFAQFKEMTIPLLYFDIGIRHLKKGDKRAIYDLSKEERQLFKELVLDKRETPAE